MERLLLIDGSSLLSTSFFGTLPKSYAFAKTDEQKEKALKDVMRSPSGEYTNGVYTMVRILERIFSTQKPTHVCIAWDISRDTFRRDLYPAYKMNRGYTRPELKSQFGLAQRVLEEMGIEQIWLPKYEADDLLGCLAKEYEEDIQTVILTKDRDALQLVTEKTRLWLMTDKQQEMYEEIGVNPSAFNIPPKTVELTPLLVKHFYGVYPNQIVDRKGLEGDPSDNIPGVKGVGETSILPLLAEFGTIDRLYDFLESADEKEAKAFMKDLGIKRSPYNLLMKTEGEMTAKEFAFLSKELSTIKTEIKGLSLPDIEHFRLNIQEEAKNKIYEELGFASLIKEPVLV